MARPIKTGLDYFPLDVDFFSDDKMLFVSSRFEEMGELIALKLLCKIYRNGYFIHWDDDVALLFAKSAGRNISHKLVHAVVQELLQRNFFDKDLFTRFSMLTSAGIQRRYTRICIDARRKDCEIPEVFLCAALKQEMAELTSAETGLMSAETQLMHAETRLTPEFSTQRKGKEKKAKESKQKESDTRAQKNSKKQIADAKTSGIAAFASQHPSPGSASPPSFEGNSKPQEATSKNETCEITARQISHPTSLKGGREAAARGFPLEGDTGGERAEQPSVIGRQSSDAQHRSASSNYRITELSNQSSAHPDKIGTGQQMSTSTHPSQEQCEQFFTQSGYARELGAKFFLTYQATGWKVNNSSVADWRALANKWLLTQKYYINEKHQRRYEPAAHGTPFGKL